MRWTPSAARRETGSVLKQLSSLLPALRLKKDRHIRPALPAKTWSERCYNSRHYTMPRPGDTISHYKLISAIGKGGMGEVYLAEDTRLERRVAIKILLDDVAGDADRVRRFIQEAKAAS